MSVFISTVLGQLGCWNFEIAALGVYIYHIAAVHDNRHRAYIFVYLLIAHLLRLSLSIQVKIYLDRVNRATGRCIFFSISAVPRQPLDVWVYIYINMTILILPLGVCIEITTGHMSLTVSGTLIPLGVYKRQSLDVWVHYSRDCINIATGRPLSIQVCLYWDSINIATGITTGCRNLPCCYCSIIVTERIGIFMDCTCIEIVAENIS